MCVCVCVREFSGLYSRVVKIAFFWDMTPRQSVTLSIYIHSYICPRHYFWTFRELKIRPRCNERTGGDCQVMLCCITEEISLQVCMRSREISVGESLVLCRIDITLVEHYLTDVTYGKC